LVVVQFILVPEVIKTMIKKLNGVGCFVTIVTICVMVGSTILPVALAGKIDNIKGFDKGVSYESVVPMKRMTFVNFDENGILDDYAYLAAVPTCVFSNGKNLFSNPLLFYQDEYPVTEDKERSLNARQGLDYFMEDWMAYSNGRLDQMTLINVPKNKLDSSWNAKEYTIINGGSPYDIANQIALSEWSYSGDAIVAVIQDQYEHPDNTTQGQVKGTVQPYNVGHEEFTVQEPVIGTGGTYKYFEINDENYKYLVSKLTWPGTNDYDLQLYDPQLGMVDSSAKLYSDYSKPNLFEITGSYIHNYGKWSVSVTAVAVKGMDLTTNNNQDGLLVTALKNLAKTIKNTGTVDVSLYPGTMINIPHSPFGCRDVDFALTWNNPSINLGLTLLDPTGTEICSSISKDAITSGEVTNEGGQTTMYVERLGECRVGENYSICVFSLDDISQPIDFTLRYSWHQNFSKVEGECFASATNGAVIASALNAPLLYVSPSTISDDTRDVLYKLGVKNIYLVNIGDHLSKDAKIKLSNIATVTEYSSAGDIYTDINKKTGNTKTTVFTTIDPWTYWYVAEDKSAGEYPGALFVGPAAYIAAHHGSPVAIVDLHPQLSQATVWPTDLWVKTSTTRGEPSSGSMLLSGKEVYSFLEEYGLGKLEPGNAAKQSQEILVTVADQYDIGPVWDRMFTGAALTGRFWGSPVDTAYSISRDVFYPAMIFVNPAMQGQTTLINGSSSRSELIGGRLKNPVGSTLVITKPSGEEKFTYPILDTFNVYGYKFNEKEWKAWGFKFSTADGVIPYETPSPDPIDDGATDKAGAYYPDMSESEVVPFYASRAGYDNVYSTSFDAAVENLNRGVIIWVENCHGWFGGGGKISMWDPNDPYNKEKNPWRVYENIMLYPGNIREFVRYIIYESYLLAGKSIPSVISNGLVKFHLLPAIGSTENPDVACANPQKVLINDIRLKLHLPIDFWAAHGIMLYRDRLKHPLQTIEEGLPFVNIYQGDGKVIISPASGQVPMIWMTGIDFDNKLSNMHSCGINTISCYPAYTYLHLTWMRHGATYVIIDPWSTSDWAGIMTQILMKRFAMGDTIGQAHELGMRTIGPEPIVGQSWWDTLENVELFGDPNLRVFVPSTDYSSNNNWQQSDTMPLIYNTDVSIDGHMPFGVTGYTNEKKPETFWQHYLWLIIVLILVMIVVAAIAISRKKK